MGAFFTNVQVAAGPGALDAVRAALEADARKAGLEPAAPGEEADRTVFVVPGPRWISIYDEESESQDDKVLDRLGKALSKAAKGPAFSVLVHDSDVLRLALYEAGKRTDAWNSNPGYFGGRTRRDAPEPHVAAWRRLAASEEPLRRVFGADDLFAEAALPVLAEAVGLEPARAHTGYRYVAEEAPPEDALRLAWRAKARPAWATPATGAPRLETQWEQAARQWGTPMPAAANRDLEASVGGDVHLGVTTVNAGGPGVGLTIEVHSDDVVRWTLVRAVLGNPKDHRVLEAPLVREGQRWVARLPDAPLPAGLADGPLPTASSDAMKFMEARFGTQVHVNVVGQGARVGRAPVTVRLAPDEGTGTAWSVGVAVRSTEGRPLRAPPGLHPMLLAPLLDRSRLVALVVLRPEAIGRADEVVRAAAPWFPPTGKVRTTRFPSPKGGLAGLASMLTGAGSPKHATGPAAGFLGGKRYKDLLDALASCGLVHAEWVDDAEAIGSAADVSLGTGLIAFPDTMPALTLGLAGASEEAARAIAGAIDTLARDGALVQALLTRWGASPSFDTTPYEVACGVQGQCTLHRPWVTRWLRGVGPGQVWLGPELRAHVGPIEGELLGDALRVEVRDVAAAEQALAPILPSAADWQQGVARRYGR